MEFLELLEVTDEYARYRYYPEQKEAVGEYGEVTYFRQTSERHFDKIANVGGFGIEYAVHACQAIANFARSGEFKQNGLIGWY